MSKLFFSALFFIGMTISQIGFANVNPESNFSQNENSTSISKTTSNKKSGYDVHVVLITPENVLSKNVTPQQVADYLSHIIGVVFDTTESNHISNNLMIDINVDSQKETFHLSYTGDIDEKQTPIFKDMMKNLYKIQKISTQDPIHIQLYFIK